MSHSGMSVAQAKELQRRYNEALRDPLDDKVDAVSLAHIVVSRDKNHKGELVSKTLKSRSGNVGLGGFTVQRFER